MAPGCWSQSLRGIDGLRALTSDDMSKRPEAGYWNLGFGLFRRFLGCLDLFFGALDFLYPGIWIWSFYPVTFPRFPVWNEWKTHLK